MTLPTSRNTTYVDGVTPVKAVDLNDVQDCIVAGKHGLLWSWQAIQRGTTEVNIDYDGGDFLHANANAALLTMPVTPAPVGSKLTAIAARVKGTGGVQNVQIALQRHNGDGTSTTIGTLVIVDPPAAWATYSFTLAAEESVVVDKSYYWFVNMPLLNTYFGGAARRAYKP